MRRVPTYTAANKCPCCKSFVPRPVPRGFRCKRCHVRLEQESPSRVRRLGDCAQSARSNPRTTRPPWGRHLALGSMLAACAGTSALAQVPYSPSERAAADSLMRATHFENSSVLGIRLPPVYRNVSQVIEIGARLSAFLPRSSDNVNNTPSLLRARTHCAQTAAREIMCNLYPFQDMRSAGTFQDSILVSFGGVCDATFDLGYWPFIRFTLGRPTRDIKESNVERQVWRTRRVIVTRASTPGVACWDWEAPTWEAPTGSGQP